MKVLVISHGHPDCYAGGAEVAAAHLHRELRRREGVDSFLLSRIGEPYPERGSSAFSAAGRDESELAIDVRHYDPFTFSNKDLAELIPNFTELLTNYEPDVVHFHHFFNVGLELVRIVRNVRPGAAILLTLYEFLAICASNGQMVKAGKQTLCTTASPLQCSRCFPHVPPGDFRLRELFIKSFFSLCDAFIASSRFLRDRYIEWGLSPERIFVIDNGFPRAEPQPPRTLSSPGEGRGRFAYFGQLHEWKGVDVLLESFAALPEEAPVEMNLEIHGANLSTQSREFRRRIEKLLESTPRVRFFGPYRNEELPRLMRGIDWVIVPSIWWENSPLVIQEAAINGRPVICSDIGGMAEKVRDGVTGLHFRVGNPASLTETLLRGAGDTGLWAQLAANLVPGPWIDEIADETIALYEVCRARRSIG